MKKTSLVGAFILVVLASPCHAEILEDIWNKYTPAPQASSAPKAELLGRIMAESTAEYRTAFSYPWKYRSVSYELHYDDQRALAKTIYGLALHAGDIDANTPLERFTGGVLGYHYSISQVCSWLNTLFTQKVVNPSPEESLLLGLLLTDGVLAILQGQFLPTGKAEHILAATKGKKRTFAQNLRHERLHVFWDEDAAFRKTALKNWQALSPDAQQAVRKRLYQYAQKNEPQLIEEWAIKQAEASNMELN